MRLIDANSIKFTEYINGDITVSKDEIDKMPTAFHKDAILEFMQEWKSNIFNQWLQKDKENTTINAFVPVITQMFNLIIYIIENNGDDIVNGKIKVEDGGIDGNSDTE